MRVRNRVVIIVGFSVICRLAEAQPTAVPGRAAASLRTIAVASDKELATAIAQVRPGDEIVIQDGSYRDWDIPVAGSGTASDPISIRAQTPGRVVLSGNSRMSIGGDYVTVSGLCFRDGRTTGEIWRLSGSHGRITDCALMNYKDGGHKWIRIEISQDNRLDHNAILGKTETDVTLQIDVSPSERMNHHRIDHNYFGCRPRGSGNGWETIRNGYSHQQNNPAYNLFECNLFHECDGENEIISSKSSHNTYRYNTFRNCAGELTLRHGKFNLVHGNCFFGGGKQGSAGIRIIGEGHRVVNNYVENTYGIGVQIYEGEDDAQATGYQAANDVLVAFNTIVRSGGDGIHVKDYPRTPKNVVIANNLIIGVTKAISDLSDTQLAESYSLHGNIACDSGMGITVPETAFRTVDSEWMRDSYGVLRPRSDSPVIGVAATGYMDFGFNVDTDLDGQTRPGGKKDVGADQVNGDGRAISRPLDVNDVGGLIGPSWMKSSATRQSSTAETKAAGQPVSPNAPGGGDPVVTDAAAASADPNARLDYAPGKAPRFWSIATAETIMARWPEYSRAYHASWTYVHGYTLYGFEMLYRATGDQRYYDFIKRYIDKHIDPNGEFRVVADGRGRERATGFGNQDNMMTGNTLVMLYEYTKDERYKKAATPIRRALDGYPRNSNGGLWHARTMNGQWWIDGIFMSQMFLTRYGRSIGDAQYCWDEATLQLGAYALAAQRDGTGLYVHGVYEAGHGGKPARWADPNGGLSQEVWSEGLGWYALVLVETLVNLPKDHARRPEMEDIFRRLAAGLRRTQDAKSGRWFQVVDKGDRPDNWTDTSGSAMFTYATAKGIEIGLIDKAEYASVVERGYKGIAENARVNDKGLVDVYSACDGLGVQTSYQRYINYRRSINAKEAVAGFLWATAMVERPDLERLARLQGREDNR